MQTAILEKKIYYYDTDCGGVVYYANYLKHLEEGRTEYCLARGIDVGKLFQKGIEFVVVHAQIDYKAPAGYGDKVTIITAVEKIGDSSIHFYQEIKKGQVLLIKAKIVWACVSREFKTIAVPEEIKKALLN
jgi:acyl-CoA thioester hydrolase